MKNKDSNGGKKILSDITYQQENNNNMEESKDKQKRNTQLDLVQERGTS